MTTTQPTTTHRKKLIEVDLPLDAINAESSREKSIRHGHPSTLHLWWARRPLASCRAVIFASMVDDPDACPDEFPTPEARRAERSRLHALIRDLVKWENTDERNPEARALLDSARYEIARSVARSRSEPLPADCRDDPAATLRYLAHSAKPIYDPFAGGGSIPLEAQRLGLKAIASDLNPVAVLINKALIELPHKFANKPPVNPKADPMGMLTGKSTGRGKTANPKSSLGAAPPDSPPTSVTTAIGCANKRSTASAAYTPRQNSPTAAKQPSSHGYGPEPSLATTPLRRRNAAYDHLPSLQKDQQQALD